MSDVVHGRGRFLECSQSRRPMMGNRKVSGGRQLLGCRLQHDPQSLRARFLFLTSRQPFVRDFDEPTAGDFYEGVACGLLHEARTKKAGGYGPTIRENW